MVYSRLVLILIFSLLGLPFTHKLSLNKDAHAV